MKFKHIISNQAILGGKPIVKGTRISVETILEWIASGGTVEGIVAKHPQLNADAVKEAVGYASHFMHNEINVEIKKVA